MNAAANLAWYGRQVLAGRDKQTVLAGLRPESRNGDLRSCETEGVHVASGRGSLEDTTPQPTADGGVVSDGDGTLVTASGRQHR